MVSRLHAKTNQIGKILNNLEKCNHMKKDGENIRSPTTPSSVLKSILNKTSPTSPRCYSSADNVSAVDYQHPPNNQQQSANNHQKPTNNQQTNNHQQSTNAQQQSLTKQPYSPNNNGQTRGNEQQNGANEKEMAKPDTPEQSKSNGEVSMEAEEQSTA